MSELIKVPTALKLSSGTIVSSSCPFLEVDIFFFSVSNWFYCKKSLRDQVARTSSQPSLAKESSNDPSKWCSILEVRDKWKPLCCGQIENGAKIGRDQAAQAVKVKGG